MLDDAHKMVEPMGNFFRIGDRSKRAIHHVISAVGNKRVFIRADPQRRFPADLLQTLLRRLPAELHYLDWHGHERSEFADQLRFVRNDHHALARRRYHFFAQQRPALAFDQIERAQFHFIGAVDAKIQLDVLGKARKRNFLLARTAPQSARK